jgi:hypothetical protein
MSQRGRSGFLSYLLLLSRVLRFEHRVEEVVGAPGNVGRLDRDLSRGWRGSTGSAHPPFSSPSPIRAAGVVSSVGLGPRSSASTEPRATCRPCSWLCCEWAGRRGRC